MLKLTQVLPEIDVLICGAGAAGLTLGIDLARRGISFRLIDKIDRPFAGSRGKGIQPRSLEVFEDLGIVDRLAAIGGPYPPQRMLRDRGRTEDLQTFAIEAPTVGEPYRTTLMVPQFRTEEVMRERLAEYGHRPRYTCELMEFDQDGDAVTVRLTGPEGDSILRCRYLIGADGGHSTVRHRLGIGFPGKTLGIRAVVADIELDGLSRDVWHRFSEDDRTRQLALCPLPHTDLFQLQAPIPYEGEADLSVGGLQAFIDERIGGRKLTVKSVAWASAYRMSARLAERYRVGRVFLIGDAAHIHPPTGGQGLNTSIQDAYNLGWKLGAVIAGAPDTLLDTYEEERRPLAAGMLGLAGDLLEKARRGNLRRGREVHQLDLGYAASSLSIEKPERNGTLLAGDRMPDARLTGTGGQTHRLFELLAGPHWTLLAFEASDLPASGPALHIHVIGRDLLDDDDAFFTACGLENGDLLLIRPDGYVGAIVDSAEALVPYLANVGAGCHPESIRFPIGA